jgi:HK97 family phage prohead protease
MPPQSKPATGPDGPAVPKRADARAAMHIESDNPECDGFAVVDADGMVESCHPTKAAAQDHMDGMDADMGASRGQLLPERRVVALEEVEFRASGSKDKGLIVRGHAAVFNRPSLDLGGFTETISQGAFEDVLATSPDVHLLWDHDSSLVLARTRSAKYALELREDPRGLHFYANVAPTSYAKDLALLMESQVVDQASFAFTVADGGDSWEIDGDERVTRTIHQIGELFDVTITAQGAYPQTDASVITNMRSRIAGAIDQGRLPEEARAALKDPEPETAEEQEGTRDDVSGALIDPEQDQQDEDAPDEGDQQDEDQQEDRSVAAEDQPGGDSSRAAGEQEERVVTGLRELQARVRVELELAKRRLLEADRK